MRIKRIKLENFKRWKNLELKFGSLNEFYAENGGGKTSIFQAFLWVLGMETENVFPKVDSELIEGLETRVELVIENNGFTHTYIRSSKPQFIIDELKIKTKKAYVDTICSQVGINQNELEIICNTYLFNQDTNKWGWSQRFSMLNKLLGFDTLALNLAKEFEIIGKHIANRKTPIEIAKILRDNKKSINTKKDTLNGGIDAIKKQLDKYNYDYDKIEREIEIKKKEIQDNEKKIVELTNKDKNDLSKQIEIVRTEILFEEKKYELDVEKNTNNLESLKTLLELKNNQISELSEEIDKLSTTIENCENEAVCVSCGQKLPIDQINYLKSKLSKEREEKLNTLDGYINFANILEEDIKKLPSEIDKPQSIELLEKKLDDLIKQLENFEQDTTNEEMINDIEIELDFLRDNLKEYEEILYGKKLKQQLEEDLRVERNKLQSLAQEFSDQAKGEEELNAYFKLIEKEYDRVVKENFGNEISFKFFTLKKDGEYNQDCFVRREIKGMMTSYNEMSLGERLKTDIITSLGFQKLLDVEFPIWVDNAQDMTDEVPSCDNQIIVLNTSKTMNNLKGEYINGK